MRVCGRDRRVSGRMSKSAQTWACVYLQCVCVCVYVCVPGYTVSFKFQHFPSHSCEVWSDMRETPQRFAITARFNTSKASASPPGVFVFSECEKKKEKKQEMIICMCTFVTILTSNFDWRASEKSRQHHIYQRAEGGNMLLCVEIKYDNCSCNSDTLQRINQSEQFNKIIAELVLCNVLGRHRSKHTVNQNNARRRSVTALQSQRA